MRQLKEYADDPRDGLLERRRHLSEAVRSWLEEGRDADTAVEVLSYALSPGVSSRELDPGAGRTVSMFDAALREDLLPKLGPTWDQMVSVVGSYPLATYEHLLRVVGDWCFPSRVSYTPDVPEGWHGVARKEIRRVMRQIIHTLPERIGLRSALARLAKTASLRIAIKEEPDFEALFPPERFRSAEELARAERRGTRRFTRRYKDADPKSVAARIAELEKEALSVQVNHPRVTPQIVELLGSDQPLEYIEALRASDAPADLYHALIKRVVDDHASGWEETMDDLLDDEATRGQAVRACLASNVGRQLTEKAVGMLKISGVRLIAYPFLNRISDHAIKPLLQQEDVDLLQDAVIALTPPLGEELPGELQRLWEDAAVKCSADATWWPEIMKGRGDLLVRWLLAWNARAQAEGSFEPFPEGLAPRIRELPRRRRSQLLAGVRPCWGLDIVLDNIVSDDAQIMSEVMKRDDLKKHFGALFRGAPSDAWFQRALIAMEVGWAPESLVINCEYEPGTWTTLVGDESAFLLQRAEAFEAYLHSKSVQRRHLAQAGVTYFRGRADEESESEDSPRLRSSQKLAVTP